MIQRIQSVFLLLAACAMALLFAFPIANYQGQTTFGTGVSAELRLIPQGQPDILAQIENGGDVIVGQGEIFTVWPLMLLAVLVLAVAVISIFLFRNRVLQMRVVAVGFLLNVIYLFLTFFWAVDSFDEAVRELNFLEGSLNMSYSIATWVPCVSVVMFLLAQRAIKRDEAKVRAADRLR